MGLDRPATCPGHPWFNAAFRYKWAFLQPRYVWKHNCDIIVKQTEEIQEIDLGEFMEGPGPDDPEFPTEAQTKVAFENLL